MPLIQVTVGRTFPPETKRALLERLTTAAHEVTGTPVAGIRVWLVEVPSDDLMVAGRTMTELTASADAADLLGTDGSTGR